MACPGTSFSLEDVTVELGSTRAIDSVTLEIGTGEAVAFVGPSGAGKTTLLGLLNASVRASSGTVRIDGRAISEFSRSELKSARACIGFVHQDLHLVPGLRVVQNVIAGRFGRMGFGSSLRAMLFPGRQMVEEAFAILQRVGIPQKIYEPVERLSGGQKQRVAIARALFQDPGALLADEPVSSVDPARARDTVALLRELSREKGLTLCMSLHNLDLAREFFPRLVGLRRGRVAFDSPTDSLSPEMFQSLYSLSPEEMLDA
ncbi:MAG: phosphonate ABC transporter ATP-binding protein [Thermoanaerobaculia bacterium]